MKETILSGIQPTGPLHLGNYVGAVRNFLRLQDEYPRQCLFFIADYHSITEDYDPETKPDQILELAAEYLALGLDPKKCTLFVQSDIPELTELGWIFNTITPIAELERMTQYKDKAGRQTKNINVGLFDYPVLMAADILLPKATAVPVGHDQIQHLELARGIARSFNKKFGVTFPEPKPLLTRIPRLMSLIDPSKKMSKSVPGSTILLADDPKTIQEKVRRAVTDTGPSEIATPPAGAREDKDTVFASPQAEVSLREIPRRGTISDMSPGVENLFTLLAEFGTKKDMERFEVEYQKKTIKYVELKDVLARRIAEHFADFRTRRAALLEKPAAIRKVLAAGAKAMRPVAEATTREVREKVGLRY